MRSTDAFENGSDKSANANEEVRGNNLFQPESNALLTYMPRMTE